MRCTIKTEEVHYQKKIYTIRREKVHDLERRGTLLEEKRYTTIKKEEVHY